MDELNGYELSRLWWNYCFDNPEKVSPNHTALYFFAIEHCNRLGWKRKFGLPTSMAMEAIGMKSYKTYKKTLLDLVEFGFVDMIEVSKNQYSSNIVALVKNTKAQTKALTKAVLKHVPKQFQSTDQSNASINKPITYNLEPITREQTSPENEDIGEVEAGNTVEYCKITLHRDYDKQRVKELWRAFCIQDHSHTSHKDKLRHFRNWIRGQPYEHKKQIVSADELRRQIEQREKQAP